MRFRTGLVAALVVAGCAGRKPATQADDPFFTLRYADAASAPTPPEPAGGVDAFAIEVSFEREDGTPLAKPRISTLPGQVGSIEITNQTSFIQDFEEAPAQDGAVADPIIGVIQDGITFAACATRADGGVTLGWRAKIVKLRKPIPVETKTVAGHAVTIQVPQIERVEVEGARRVEPGALAMLARVSSPDGGLPVQILARVTSIHVDPASATATPVAPGDLGRAMTKPAVHLRVLAVQAARDFEPGVVVDESAAPDLLKAAGGRVLREFEVYTCVDSRVRLAGLLQDGHDLKNRGLVVEAADDGTLRFTWTLGDAARTASLRPSAGRRFVALGKVADGSTAGVIVSVDSD